MAWQEVQDVREASDVQDEVVVEVEDHSPAMTALDDDDRTTSDVNVPWDHVFADRERREQMALPVPVGEWDEQTTIPQVGERDYIDEYGFDFGGPWVLHSPTLNTAQEYFNNAEPEPEPEPGSTWLEQVGSPESSMVGRPNPTAPTDVLRGTSGPHSQPVTPGVPPPATPLNLTAQPVTPPGLLSRRNLRTPSPIGRLGRRRLS